MPAVDACLEGVGVWDIAADNFYPVPVVPSGHDAVGGARILEYLTVWSAL